MESGARNLQKIIGSRIKEFRTKRNLTQEELASKANLHTTFIAHIESGKKTCSVKSLKKIASALKVPIHLLFIRSGKVSEISYDMPIKRLISLIKDRSDADKELLISIVSSVFQKKKKTYHR
jgi:transcriptional regulator with XRE-family HTH domain